MVLRLSVATLVLITGCATAQPPSLTYTLLVENIEDPENLVTGSGGVLYGTTGPETHQAYSVAPPASPGAPWTYTVIHTFNGGADGNPNPGLVIGKGGVLYGTTYEGGCAGTGTPNPVCGIVYSLTPPASSGGTWTEDIIYKFGKNTSPTTGVVIGAGGVLYGSTVFGGANGDGAIFSLTPPESPGTPWTYTLLYSFTGGSDGHGPVKFVMGKDGILFGTTSNGGTGHGTLFALKPPAAPGDTWTKEILCSFAGGSSGDDPSV